MQGSACQTPSLTYRQVRSLIDKWPVSHVTCSMCCQVVKLKMQVSQQTKRRQCLECLPALAAKYIPPVDYMCAASRQTYRTLEQRLLNEAASASCFTVLACYLNWWLDSGRSCLDGLLFTMWSLTQPSQPPSTGSDAICACRPHWLDSRAWKARRSLAVMPMAPGCSCSSSRSAAAAAGSMCRGGGVWSAWQAGWPAAVSNPLLEALGGQESAMETGDLFPTCKLSDTLASLLKGFPVS